MICFRNIIKGSRYQLTAEEEGLRFRTPEQDGLLPWNSIQELHLEHLETAGLQVGYARLVGSAGIEIAWTDHGLLLRGDSSYWSAKAFRVPASGGDSTDLLSVHRGLVLVSVVIDRAGLVERTEGVFIRSESAAASVCSTCCRSAFWTVVAS